VRLFWTSCEPSRSIPGLLAGTRAALHNGRPRAFYFDSGRNVVSAHRSASDCEIQLFTDGACSGNPGPGGWAFILRHTVTGKEMEASGGEPDTTNNRMELTAVVRGLESLKRSCRVEILTDSVYVGKGMSEWMPKWKANGWRRKEQNRWMPVKNEDLWRRLDELLAMHETRYTRVAGHSGHPENERCDELAVLACQQYR
jgi:ribonuclease HI